MQAPFSRTMFELLLEQAGRRPMHPAVIAGNVTLSYADLAMRASSVAARLMADGVKRGDRVGLLGNNSPEWLEIFFGAAALGAVVAPFSTWSTTAELEFLLQDARVSTLFTMRGFGDHNFDESIQALRAGGTVPDLKRVVVYDGQRGMGDVDFAEYQTGSLATLPPPGESASAADTLVMLYTSGSSSRPKCVPLTHGGAIENAFNIGERQGIQPDDKVLISIPLFWSYGAVNALPAVLSHGATLVLQKRFQPAEALDIIERQGCTGFYTLPAMTSALLAEPGFSLDRTKTLRTGVTIGAPQDVRRTAEELGISDICNIYGSTEGYGNSCVTPHDWPLEQRIQCQGPPLPGVTVRIRDPETGGLLGAGEVGEIEFSGYLTPGYAGDSAQHNANVFTADGFFRTGDLGALNADGSLGYAGRLSEIIKSSGINVSPVEVEEAMQQHPDVALVGVTGVEDAVKGELIVAYVVARPGAAPTPDTLRQHCRTLLSAYKTPARIILTDSLPLTATGKLMRRDLRVMAAAAQY